jgi:hypothetical protein
MPNCERSTEDLLDSPRCLRIQYREWLAERIGWIAGCVILLSATLGGCGSGAISHRNRSTPDGRLSIEYEALVRHSAPSRLVMRIRPERDVADRRDPERTRPFQIGISRSFVEQTSHFDFVPVAERTELRGNTIIYEFRGAPLAQPLQINCRYQYTGFGFTQCQVSLDETTSLKISQFAYP